MRAMRPWPIHTCCCTIRACACAFVRSSLINRRIGIHKACKLTQIQCGSPELLRIVMPAEKSGRLCIIEMALLYVLYGHSSVHVFALIDHDC